jgi:hypothetical protein
MLVLCLVRCWLRCCWSAPPAKKTDGVRLVRPTSWGNGILNRDAVLELAPRLSRTPRKMWWGFHFSALQGTPTWGFWGCWGSWGSGEGNR